MRSLKKMVRTRVKKPIKKLQYNLDSTYRQATWRNRALPDFIIIGAMKSGTTSLFNYLGQHPQIFPSNKKEIHFFDGGTNQNIDNFVKGQSWYRAHFPLKNDMVPGSKTFEASPLYIFNPIAPKRIFNLVPDVKIIVILRDPTERAISHYFHEKRKNREKLSPYEAFQKEEKRLEPIIKEKNYKSEIFKCHSYKSRGLYKEQIERYLNFFPRKQILILNSEKLFSDPDNTLRQVFDFVGVDAEFKVSNLKPRNVSSNRSEVNPEVYEYLNDFFMPHNQALYELIGENYNW